MSISSELSTDIAVALLAAKDKYPGELSDLLEVIFEVHSALRQASEQQRRGRRELRFAAAESEAPSSPD